MALNIAEHNRVGDLYGNALANMGKTFADAFEKKNEERKQIKQADSATKGYLKAMASFETDPAKKAQIEEMLNDDPTKPLTETILGRQSFIQSKNYEMELAKNESQRKLIEQQILAEQGQVRYRDAQTAALLNEANNPKQPFTPRVINVGGRDFGYTSPNSGQFFDDKTGAPKDTAPVRTNRYYADLIKRMREGDDDAFTELRIADSGNDPISKMISAEDIAAYQEAKKKKSGAAVETTPPPPPRLFPVTPVN